MARRSASVEQSVVTDSVHAGSAGMPKTVPGPPSVSAQWHLAVDHGSRKFDCQHMTRKEGQILSVHDRRLTHRFPEEGTNHPNTPSGALTFARELRDDLGVPSVVLLLRW